MAPQPCRPGTIFFQEDVILVQPSPRDEDWLQKGGAPALKLPLLRSPRTPTSPAGEQLPSAQTARPPPVRLPSLASPSRPTADAAAGPPPLSAPSSPARARSPSDGELFALEAEAPQPQARPRRRRKQPRQAEKQSRVAVVGNKTLAEVVRAKDAAGGAVCRYDCVEHELHKALAVKSQMASRRREVARQAGDSARARARKRGTRRKQPTQQVQPQVEQDADTCVETGVEVEESAEVRPATGSPSPGCADAAEPTFTIDRAYKDRVLSKLKLKHGKMYRLNHLTRARHLHVAECREAHRNELRQLEFEMLPIKEQDALRAAYDLSFRAFEEKRAFPKRRNAKIERRNSLLDRYHPAAKALLDSSNQLYVCLTLLGLGGDTDLQRKETKLICSEANIDGDFDFVRFAVELVPRVRAKLIELRQEALSEQFNFYDQDRNGLLDFEECFDILKKLCRNLDGVGYAQVEPEFNELFDTLSVEDEHGRHVDFDGFQMLIERVREKCECVRRQRECDIMHERGLTQEIVANYVDELLMLNQTFNAHDADENGGLDDTEVVGALLEHGLVPKAAGQRAHVEWLVMQAAYGTSEGLITFSRFLELVRKVREASRDFEEDRLMEYFRDCDKDGNGLLTFAEAAVMFEKLGLVPKCRDDQDEMKELLLKVDVNDSGDIDFKEFQHLVQHITEKLRSNQRQRENALGASLGFSLHQVADFREIFFHLEPGFVGAESEPARIGIEECRKVLTLARTHMEPAKLKALLGSLDSTSKDTKLTGRIDLEGFLLFMKAVEDSQKAEAPPDPKDEVNRLAALWGH